MGHLSFFIDIIFFPVFFFPFFFFPLHLSTDTQTMGFFTEDIQKTSVSLYIGKHRAANVVSWCSMLSVFIERLSNLEEVDWYLLQQLTESIQMQENGPREAVETVRKKLKHGGTQQKLRVLEVGSLIWIWISVLSVCVLYYAQILKLLMENSNQQFHSKWKRESVCGNEDGVIDGME